MGTHTFTDEDLREIKEHGLTLEEVERQLELFRNPPPYLRLVRPCIPGDGIKVLEEQEMQDLEDIYQREVFKGRCIKFVPASGAASRMFNPLLLYMGQGREIEKESVAADAQRGNRDAQELLDFMNGVERFAFFRDLEPLMLKKGVPLQTLIERGQFADIVRFLLTEEGLGYANLPKALIKFHHYPGGDRTAFEEHLIEAVHYVADRSRSCSLHFTVSADHLIDFHDLLGRVKGAYEKQYKVSFRVGFSTQKKSTETLAVDMNNRPLRDADGRLVFRPGGHGALIENLNDLEGDIVFAKNIDNVVPDRLKSMTFKWKKILGGHLITLQNQIFTYMGKLSSGAEDPSFHREVENFLKNELFLQLPPSTVKEKPGEKRKALMARLDRPIRVCGMVRNQGEPGGGPFWVRDREGGTSCQIVETAQVDPEDKKQQAILASSTHFNPVDLVCGVRDWQQRPFDLRRYVDPTAVLISYKSQGGRDLKALEHPGLWNGAMARWITIFVEVPLITFNPVKTVNDLLRPEHQPG
jgi:hypothetical protein